MLRGILGTGGSAPVGGSGTPGTIPVWSTGTTLGDSQLIQSATAIYTTTRNVGIGTPSPIADAKLTLNEASSSATVKESFATNSVERAFISMNASTGELRVSAGYGGYGGFTAFYTNGAEAARINSSGNVGIGTASPVEAFNVKRGAGLSAYAEFAGNNNALGSASVLYGQDSGSNGYFYNRANAPLIFGTNNTERVRIDGSGNVGIGTPSPSAGLDTPASTTTRSGFRVRSGTAPTSPNVGDIWFDGTNLKMCTSAGVTKTFTLT